MIFYCLFLLQILVSGYLCYFNSSSTFVERGKQAASTAIFFNFDCCAELVHYCCAATISYLWDTPSTNHRGSSRPPLHLAARVVWYAVYIVAYGVYGPCDGVGLAHDRYEDIPRPFSERLSMHCS